MLGIVSQEIYWGLLWLTEVPWEFMRLRLSSRQRKEFQGFTPPKNMHMP